MKKKLLTGLLLGGVLTAIALKPSSRIGPDYLYPDPQYTPGLVATSDLKELTSKTACGTYSQCHRHTTQAMKTTVCKEYPTNCTGTQEADHEIPICAGGADSISNLWEQPKVNMWNGEDYGYPTKDKLESEVCREIRSGEVSPKEAQSKLGNDWVAYYLELVNRGKIISGLYGSVMASSDEDDTVGN